MARLIGIIAGLVPACNAMPPQAPDGTGGVVSRRMERQFTERLRWEAIWNDSSVPIRLQPTAKLAIGVKGKYLFYCSHDLGKCAQYLVVDKQLDRGVASTACGDAGIVCREGQADIESLKIFMQQADKASPIPTPRALPPMFGGTITGIPMPGSAVIGNMTVSLGTKQQIIDDYRRAPREPINSLEAWLRNYLRNAQYHFVIIPCSPVSAPNIFIYGERVTGGPILFSVRWDPEEEEWVSVGMLEWHQGASTIQETKAIIESLTCKVVTFD